MKSIHFQAIRSFVMGLGAALCLQWGSLSSKAQEKVLQVEFPFVVQLELGATEFAPADNIVITSVRGDRSRLEPGGRYLVGRLLYTNFGGSADLALYTTSRGPSGPSPVMDDQHVKISNGSGEFHLKKTLQDDGWLHISFYVRGHSHGGIYFGETGSENTILRKKGWSDFSSSTGRSQGDGKRANSETSRSDLNNPANLAILAYLGNPVPAPADLAARYARTNLVAAFNELSRKANLRIKSLDVDESEFPFLAYGVLAGKCDFRVLEIGLREMKGYGYGGSVVGSTHNGATYFALNMIPQEAYPSGWGSACQRRLMIRLQMLADAAGQNE